MRAFDDLDAHGGSVGRGDSCGAQHRELRENFVVDLGDEIILAIRFTAPDLPELDRIYGHECFPDFDGMIPEYRAR